MKSSIREARKSLESPAKARRPSFFRKRSKSVPTLGWASIPAAEAGILFSTAEKAASRRRRPKSEHSPNAHHWEESDETLRPLSPVKASEPFPAELRDISYFSEAASLSSPTPTPTTPHFRDISYETPKQQSRVTFESPDFRQIQYVTPELIVSNFEDDNVSTIESTVEEDHYDEVLSTPTTITSIPSPVSDLRDYAASLRHFTKSRLEIVVPKPPSRNDSVIPLGGNDSYFFHFSPPATPQTFDTLRPERPKLTSHFSDWSQTTADDDMDPLSRVGSALQTPEESPRFMDSPSCEATPRVASFSFGGTTMVSESGSPGMTRPNSYLFHASSLFDADTQSPMALTESPMQFAEPKSYFDWSTDNSVTNTPWPLNAEVEHAIRNSIPQLPLTPGSGLSPFFASMAIAPTMNSPSWAVPTIG